jgi:hypothetical protein
VVHPANYGTFLSHFEVVDGEAAEDSALSSLRVDSLVKERRAYGIEFTPVPIF